MLDADVRELLEDQGVDIEARQVAIQFKDEGSALGSSGTGASLDFVGAGVTAARVANAITVTIPGGGGGPGSVVSDTIWDAKGDLAAGTGADAAARLPVGANDTFLVPDSTLSTGLKWITAAAVKTLLALVKGDVGLSNVDNTSDTNKPVSTAQQTALDLKANIASPTFTGTVGGITKSMVGLGNVDNTSDVNKTVSTATQAALDLKADLASPALTGNPTTPNQVAGTNNTRIANTKYVDEAIAQLINAAPGALDTLDELAAAMGDDANFAATVTTALALKAPLASPTFTGNPLAPTPTAGDNDTSIATTAFVQNAVPNSSYRSLLDCSGSHIAARVAGTYWLGQSQPAGITGTGTLYPPNIIYIDSADYPTFDGKAPKLRIRAQVYCNDVAPFTGTFIFGLHPVTRPATSGGAGLCIYTVGAAVAGSTVTLTNPAADSSNILAGADFALPTNGHYVIGFVTNQAMAASSHAHLSAILQLRNA